jgi:SOS-response transcriptional repressor LexA
MLTRQQAALLTFVDEFTRERGYGPSYVEIAVGVGSKSKGHVASLVKGLVQREFMISRPNQSRSLQVLRLPDGSAPAGKTLDAEAIYAIAHDEIYTVLSGFGLADDASTATTNALAALEAAGIGLTRIPPVKASP